MAIDYSFLEGVAPQQAAPQDDMANVTLRIDADALLLCDGEHIDIELKAGVVKKTQLPVGEHLLEFLSEENPDAKVEKVVDFPVAGKSYLVMVSGLKEALAQFETKATVALGAKRVFRLIINGYDNEMSAMMVVRNILGCSVTEARAKLAELPAVVIESEDNARVEALAGQFAKGNVEVVVETRNGHGELVESDSYETAGTGGDFLLNTADDYYKKGNYEEAVKWYTKAAEQGNADAMNQLGKYYYDGHEIVRDKEEAVKWYRKAAEQGNADAMLELGKCYYYGRGVEEDKEEAAKWYRKAAEQYRKAAEQGNADAMFALGGCYEDGCGVEEDEEEAAKWYRKAVEQYRKAAEQGDADAMRKLGKCYGDGSGVEKDYEEAVKWYRKAAEQGNADAMYKLGRYYEPFYDDDDDAEENYKKAAKWYLKAAQKGHAYAMWHLGECYLNGDGVEKDKEEALIWYSKSAELGHEYAMRAIYFIEVFEQDLKSAEQGNTDAMCEVAYDYSDGIGVELDYEESVKWYRKAAELGNAYAMYKLGECYYEGEGVEKDKEEAVKWYRKAAEQGHAAAQCVFGYLYYDGEGVLQNYCEAVEWFRKSAEQGDGEACYYLAECYYHGKGVYQDYDEALRWSSKSLQLEYPQAVIQEELIKSDRDKKNR